MIDIQYQLMMKLHIIISLARIYWKRIKEYLPHLPGYENQMTQNCICYFVEISVQVHDIGVYNYINLLCCINDTKYNF